MIRPVKPGTLCHSMIDVNIAINGITIKDGGWSFNSRTNNDRLPLLAKSEPFIVVAVSREPYAFRPEEDTRAIYMIGSVGIVGWLTNRGVMDAVRDGKWTVEEAHSEER